VPFDKFMEAHSHLLCRDLGTEGALDADVSLRQCLAGKDAIIPGPRYYCATRAIVTSGAYGASPFNL
jgi:hypothetical protein